MDLTMITRFPRNHYTPGNSQNQLNQFIPINHLIFVKSIISTEYPDLLESIDSQKIIGFTRTTRFNRIIRFTRITRWTKITRGITFTRFTKITTFLRITKITQFTSESTNHPESLESKLTPESQEFCRITIFTCI